jgi:DNA-binding MarR family transcriptional regulator
VVTDDGDAPADFHVLNALCSTPDHKPQVTDLAAFIGGERSRLSHHLRRLCDRGLADASSRKTTGRATDAVLTEKGMNAVIAATPGHAALVRRLFFDAMPDELVSPFTAALERIELSLNLDSSQPPFPP